MWSLIVGFAAIGLGPLVGEGLPVAPVDIEIGRQLVALRKPLIAKRPGVRLVLYVRDTSNLGIAGPDVTDAFESAIPEGSVVAYLSGTDNQQLTLRQTGYSFYRGYAGIVLSAPSAQPSMARYQYLELDTKVALKGVRFVWLDRHGRRVEDVAPSL
jgi:hypothetical protein